MSLTVAERLTLCVELGLNQVLHLKKCRPQVMDFDVHFKDQCKDAAPYLPQLITLAWSKLLPHLQQKADPIEASLFLISDHLSRWTPTLEAELTVSLMLKTTRLSQKRFSNE